ncbi:MAG: hypothetical protein AABX38_00935 [Candidatus Micrarchaeota archaeon]
MTTFDEDIISTDIDRIIKIVSNRKKISLNDLEKQTGINRKVLETWVKVLEDEKVISVDYGLTSKTISWMGGDAEEIEMQVEEKEIIQSHWKSHVQEQKSAGTNFDSYSSESEYEKVNGTKETKIAPNISSLKQIMMDDVSDQATEKEAKEESKQISLDFDAPIIDSEITMSDSNVLVQEEKETETAKTVEPEPSVIQTPVKVEKISDLQKESAPLSIREVIKSKEKLVSIAKAQVSDSKVNMKDAVSIYLREIGKQKGVLEQLKKEKEKIYDQRSKSLEAKVDSQIDSIAEKILEKEGRIIELKEQMLDLPDKVSELDKLQNLMGKIEVESKDAIVKTRQKLSELAASIESSKSAVKSKMDQGNALISKEIQKINELEQIEARVLQSIEKANGSISQTKSELDKLNASVDQMSDEISHLTEMKTDISEICHSIKISVESKEQEISSLANELDDIGRIEQWISEYVNDYEQKIVEVTDYINRSEDEIGELRQASEAEYIKRYLAELDDITRNYEKESEEIEIQGQELDYSIGQAKQKLDALVNESKLLLKKYHGQSGSVINRASFEETLSRVRQGAESVNKKLAEKSSEREKLKDEGRAVKDKRTKKEEEIKVRAKDRRRKGNGKK